MQAVILALVSLRCSVYARRSQIQDTHKADEEFPVNFHVQDEWPFLRVMLSRRTPDSSIPLEQTSNGCWAAAAMTCVNMRGAICHGRPPTQWYNMSQMLQIAQREPEEDGCVTEVFENFGTLRELKTPIDIKRELMLYGPVVANSFNLTQGPALAKSFGLTRNFKGKNARAHVPAADPGSEEGSHAMVILGWEMSKDGEVWVVQNSWGPRSTLTKIAFGQKNIDAVTAPDVQGVCNQHWQAGKWFSDALPETLSNSTYNENGQHWTEWDVISTEVPWSHFGDLLKLFNANCFQDIVGETIIRSAQERAAMSQEYKITRIAPSTDFKHAVLSMKQVKGTLNASSVIRDFKDAVLNIKEVEGSQDKSSLMMSLMMAGGIVLACLLMNPWAAYKAVMWGMGKTAIWTIASLIGIALGVLDNLDKFNFDE